jgi:hypothetical protein
VGSIDVAVSMNPTNFDVEQVMDLDVEQEPLECWRTIGARLERFGPGSWVRALRSQGFGSGCLCGKLSTPAGGIETALLVSEIFVP